MRKRKDPGYRSTTPAHRRPRLSIESLEKRIMLASDVLLTNPIQPLDVNRDATISAVDALQVNGIEIESDETVTVALNRKLPDADGDHEPGGKSLTSFRTLPLTRIANTNVFGFVRDSYSGNPIVGATIRVDAFPEANAVTLSPMGRG